MKVQLIDSSSSFLDMTARRRASDPLRTNVIASVAQSVQSGRSRYDHCRWWVVTEGDDVVAMAMRTSPHPMVVAPTSRDAALALGADVSREDDDLPGLSGPRDVVEHVVEGYRASGSRGSRRSTRVTRRELMYEVGSLTTPSVEGRGRPAQLRDTESLAAMLLQFIDSGGSPGSGRHRPGRGHDRTDDPGGPWCTEDVTVEPVPENHRAPRIAGSSFCGARSVGRTRPTISLGAVPGSLCGGTHIDNLARLFQRQVEPLLTLQTVEGHVVRLANRCQIRTFLRAGGRGAGPRTIAEIHDPIAMDVSTAKRVSAFEGMVVVFEHNIHVVA